MKHDEACPWRQACHGENLAQRHSGPLTDGAPTFDAIMARDLRTRRQEPQCRQGEMQRFRDQAIDLEPPVLKLCLSQALVLDRIRRAGAIRLESGRDVRRSEFMGERMTADQRALSQKVEPLRAPQLPFKGG